MNSKYRVEYVDIRSPQIKRYKIVEANTRKEAELVASTFYDSVTGVTTMLPESEQGSMDLLRSDGPVQTFLKSRSRLFDALGEVAFFQRELETKFPADVDAFRARWEAKGVSDRLINRALKYVEDTTFGQVGFVLRGGDGMEERQRLIEQNFKRGVAPGGIGDQWIEGLQRAFT